MKRYAVVTHTVKELRIECAADGRKIPINSQCVQVNEAGKATKHYCLYCGIGRIRGAIRTHGLTIAALEITLKNAEVANYLVTKEAGV